MSKRIRTYNGVTERYCINCFTWKPLPAFYRKLESHQSRCIVCNPEVVRGYVNDKRVAAGLKPLKGFE